jgi:hypothetical protein
MAFPFRIARASVAGLFLGLVPLVTSPPPEALAANPGDTDLVVREDGIFSEVVRKGVEVNTGSNSLENVQYVKRTRRWSERPVRYEQTGVQTVRRERLVPVIENVTVAVPDWVVQEQWLPRIERMTAQGTRSVTVPERVASRRWVSRDEARLLGASLSDDDREDDDRDDEDGKESVRDVVVWRWTARTETVEVPRYAWVPGAWLPSEVETLVSPDLVWATKSVPVWKLGYWEKDLVTQERLVPVLATVSVQVNASENHDHDEEVPRVVEVDESSGRVLIEEQVPVTDTVEEIGYENKLVPQLVLRADGTYGLEDRLLPVASTRSVQVPRMVTREVPTKQDVEEQVWDRVQVTVPGNRTELIAREARMATESYEVTLPRHEWVPTGDWVAHTALIRTDREVLNTVSLDAYQGARGESSSGRTSAFSSNRLVGDGKVQISGSETREALGSQAANVSSSREYKKPGKKGHSGSTYGR